MDILNTLGMGGQKQLKINYWVVKFTKHRLLTDWYQEYNIGLVKLTRDGLLGCWIHYKCDRKKCETF